MEADGPQRHFPIKVKGAMQLRTPRLVKREAGHGCPLKLEGHLRGPCSSGRPDWLSGEAGHGCPVKLEGHRRGPCSSGR